MANKAGPNHLGPSLMTLIINTLRPRQNGRHFADDIFKCIFLTENVWIPIDISLKFVPKGQINNIPALVQMMAWRRPGDKPLSEPMMVSLTTHICVTRPQWVKMDCELTYIMITLLSGHIQLYDMIWSFIFSYKQHNLSTNSYIFYDAGPWCFTIPHVHVLKQLHVPKSYLFIFTYSIFASCGAYSCSTYLNRLQL